MGQTTAGLLSPRRLVIWYLIVALVGIALMATAGPPDDIAPSPVLSPTTTTPTR